MAPQLCVYLRVIPGIVDGGVGTSAGERAGGREECEVWSLCKHSFLEAARGNSDPSCEFRIQIAF